MGLDRQDKFGSAEDRFRRLAGGSGDMAQDTARHVAHLYFEHIGKVGGSQQQILDQVIISDQQRTGAAGCNIARQGEGLVLEAAERDSRLLLG